MVGAAGDGPFRLLTELAFVHPDTTVPVVRQRAPDPLRRGLRDPGRLLPGSKVTIAKWAKEAAVSRLYGGIHFRSDDEPGSRSAGRVAAAARVRFAPDR